MPNNTTPILDIYCDGGARGNPGPAACAFVVKDHKGNQIYSQGKNLGTATNNFAEYQAVLESLIWLTEKYSGIADLKTANFYLDSLLVVSQINGVYKVKDLKLKEIHHGILALITSASSVKFKFTFIPRTRNYLADLLVNETLDKVM